jgi:ppGpp synthetase/RelA/SpoT-type nucleotidyltranferase
MLNPQTPVQVPFSIDDFGSWYDGYRDQLLEPARENAVKALNELLDEELSERDRVRVEVRPGRIKGRARAWQKLNHRYADMVASPADVPQVMDDLVGLRIVCTNVSDLQRVRDILDDLETWSTGERPVLAVHSAESERDYLGEGKPSGYRAYQVNLCTSVQVAVERHVVVCELQLRTLLQDSWGELTHEDTYKPGNEPPPLVRTLSKRMADLMATLDDMAQDLRDELERIAVTATEGPMSEDEDGPASSAEFNAVDREAAYAYLTDRVTRLTHPIDWASLAWEMQRQFGQDIVNGWLGHASFKEMLLEVVPDEQVVTDSPGYILPRDFNTKSYGFGTSAQAPRAALLLHETDKTFPLVDTASWQQAYSALAEATSTTCEGEEVTAISTLTKRAREIAHTADGFVSRRQLNHIARALMEARELRAGMSAEEVADGFRAWTRARVVPFCAAPGELAELDAWLGG